MVALLPMFVLLAMSWRRPGFALTGLFFGYPATLLSGVGGVTTLYTAAVLGLLLLRHNRDLGRISPTPIDGAMYCLIIIITLSTLWSPAQYPLNEWANLIQALLGVFIIAKLAVSYGNSIHRIDEFIIGLAVTSVVYGLLILSVADITGSRLKLFDEGNVAVGLTQAFVLGSISGLALLLRRGRAINFSRLLGAAAIGMNSWAIILTGTRGAFIAVAAGWVAFIYLTLGPKRLFFTVSMLIPVIVVAINALPGRMLLLLPEFRIFRFDTYGDVTDPSSIQRIWRFDRAWEMITDAPLFGKGIGSYNALTTFGYPHNFFLDILVHIGIFGLVAVLAVGLATILSIRKMQLARMSNSTICLCAILLAGLAHQQVSFALAHAKPLFLIGAVSRFSLAGLHLTKARRLQILILPMRFRKTPPDTNIR